eukprot:jgi/Chrpa1/21302/Chrysochromulina_OHIO_Genome00025907-RA
MLAASTQSFAGDNLKHVEEHGAAEARAIAVHGNAQSKQRLLDLGAKMSSGMSNADKITAHAQVCETDAKVAALLASSHIKRITGALALTPGLAEVAAVAGQVRAAVVRAAKEELRAQEHVRPYAEPEALVKAVQAGRLYDKGSNALSLKPLAGTEKELEYLAQPAISPKPSAAAAELAVTRNLFAAIPLLQTIFGMAAPWDTTAVKTLANIHTVMAHGLAKHGASTTVLNVLMPVLREYEERVDAFQRSPSAEIPDLASCWAHTKTLAITATFITEARKQMANLDIASDAQALKAQHDLRDALRRLEVEGISPVPARWTAYLEKHNRLARFAADVADAANKAGIVWLIENPASRRGGWAWWPAFADAPTIWDLPQFVALRNRTAATRVTFAQCQFGAEYQKYTSVMASASAGAALHRALGGARCGCASHAKLAVGRDEFGASLSAPSAAYPPALNTALARVLVSAVVFPETVAAPREPLVARELGEVLNGISDDVPALEGSFLCAPHTGALQFFEQAEKRVQAGITAGWSSAHGACMDALSTSKCIVARRICT